MKKIIAIMLASIFIALPISFATYAYADDAEITLPVDEGNDDDDDVEISSVSSYYSNGDLNFFLYADGYDLSEESVELYIGENNNMGTSSPVPISDKGVTYMFLIDASMSDNEQDCKNNIEDCVNAMVDSASETTVYYIASYDNGILDVFSENMSGTNDVSEAVEENVTFDSSNSFDSNDCLSQTYEYLGTLSHERGELFCLVLFTDKLEITDSTTETSTTSVSLGGGDILTVNHTLLQIVNMGENTAGIANIPDYCRLVGEDNDAVTAGEEIASYIDGIYALSYSLPTGISSDTIVSIRFSDNINRIFEFDILSDGNDESGGTDGDTESSTDTDPDTGTETEGESGSDTESVDSESATDVCQGTVVEKDNMLIVVVIVLIAVLILLSVLIVILLKNGKRDRKSHAQSSSRGSAGILIGIEISAGSGKHQKQQLLLQNELFIGSSPDCDIVLNDASVSERSCRIFARDRFIWIEDLNKKSNTSIGGMRIYVANRLRSEDEITVGKVKLKLYF